MLENQERDWRKQPNFSWAVSECVLVISKYLYPRPLYLFTFIIMGFVILTSGGKFPDFMKIFMKVAEYFFLFKY